MARSTSIHRSLLGNLSLVIVLLSGAIMTMTLLGSQQTVRTLSQSLIRQTIEQTEVRLRRFFDPVVHGLNLARSWGEAGLLDTDNPIALNHLFVPLVQQYPQISSLLVADSRGREHMLLRTGSTWRNRQTRRDVWGDRTHWLTWTDTQPEPVASWQELDYDPRRRPWYQGAIRARHSRPSAAIIPDPTSQVYWTPPYTFFTTKDTGITASLLFDTGDGLDHVIGFDVLLNDISTFTTSLHVSEHGKVLVFTDEGRVIGLPRAARYANPKARQDVLLKQPHELGIPVVSDATRALAAQPVDHHEPVRFFSNGQPWWGDAEPFALAPDRMLSITVVVPEADLLGSLTHIRLWILLITLAVLAVAMIRAAVLARRYSRPIEALVSESERISRGDLERGAMVASRVTEVHRLAEAHEHMRVALRMLFKLERDLQIARQIQQNTLPERLPELRGFEIDAWSEAADETGGDMYDVIGYQRALTDRSNRLSADHADHAVLLLADATGHGIGPALSVTEVRAMLRMAVRTGEPLPIIIQHMNAQLGADLRDERLITAWIGELHATNHTLTSFSCGQAPLFYYDALRHLCELREADTFPFGVFDDLEVTMSEPIHMHPGDIFVVISDGMFEAMDHSGEQFGIERIIEVIVAHRHASATQLLTALRQAVAAFTQGLPANDDRTALVIKRTHDR